MLHGAVFQYLNVGTFSSWMTAITSNFWVGLSRRELSHMLKNFVSMYLENEQGLTTSHLTLGSFLIAEVKGKSSPRTDASSMKKLEILPFVKRFLDLSFSLDRANVNIALLAD